MSTALPDGRIPDLDSLVECGDRVAEAMRQARPDATQASAFFAEVLHRPQEQGGRDLWGCFSAGLITETELRNAVMARYATWLSQVNGASEPSSEAWSSADLDRCFELALFGRPAVPDRGSAGAALSWTGLHGERVQLAIRGYQFPEVTEGHDANWLLVEGTFANERGSWRRVDACLLTWELQWLARWLPAAVTGNADADLGFLEGELQFRCLTSGFDPTGHCLAVVLDHGFSPTVRPPPDRRRWQRDQTVVVTRLSHDQLSSSVRILERWVREFPVRGEQGRASLLTLPGPWIGTEHD